MSETESARIKLIKKKNFWCTFQSSDFTLSASDILVQNQKHIKCNTTTHESEHQKRGSEINLSLHFILSSVALFSDYTGIIKYRG